MAEDFKLLHSGDWHLEQPLCGIPQLPDGLSELARTGAYQAAEQVIETALVEGVDALLLSGDIVDLSHAGPRAILFLQEQFGRLATRGIPVFWAGGRCDGPDTWPAAAPLPENVVRFPVGRVEQHEVRRDGKLLLRVQGISSASDGRVDVSGFHRDAKGVYTAGVAFSTTDSAGKEGDRVDYMALGGRHRRATVDTEPGIAHYCGTPQGRTPDESGPCGATLVRVDSGKATLKFIATDVVRWTHESIEFTAGTSVEQLEQRIIERIDRLRSQSQGNDQLVAWHLRGQGPLAYQLRPGGDADELLTNLQKYAANKQPLVYSVRLVCEAEAKPPEEWYDQETILGDLLRELRKYENDKSLPLELATLLPEKLADPSLRSIAKIESGDHRAAIIQRAKKLGLDLMTSPAAAEKELQNA